MRTQTNLHFHSLQKPILLRKMDILLKLLLSDTTKNTTQRSTTYVLFHQGSRWQGRAHAGNNWSRKLEFFFSTNWHAGMSKLTHSLLLTVCVTLIKVNGAVVETGHVWCDLCCAWYHLDRHPFRYFYNQYFENSVTILSHLIAFSAELRVKILQSIRALNFLKWCTMLFVLKLLILFLFTNHYDWGYSLKRYIVD